jgi:hypothetical protein
MSCPFCTDAKERFDYSGGDCSLQTLGLPVPPLVQSLTLHYTSAPAISKTLSRCNVCGSFWLITYDYPDHPPLFLHAERIREKQDLINAAGVIQKELDTNLHDTMIEEDDYRDRSKILAHLLDTYEHI